MRPIKKGLSLLLVFALVLSLLPTVAFAVGRTITVPFGTNCKWTYKENGTESQLIISADGPDPSFSGEELNNIFATLLLISPQTLTKFIVKDNIRATGSRLFPVFPNPTAP